MNRNHRLPIGQKESEATQLLKGPNKKLFNKRYHQLNLMYKVIMESPREITFTS